MRSHGRQEVMKVLKGKGSEPRILYEANSQKFIKVFRLECGILRTEEFCKDMDESVS